MARVKSDCEHVMPCASALFNECTEVSEMEGVGGLRAHEVLAHGKAGGFVGAGDSHVGFVAIDDRDGVAILAADGDVVGDGVVRNKRANGIMHHDHAVTVHARCHQSVDAVTHRAIGCVARGYAVPELGEAMTARLRLDIAVPLG